MPEDSIDHINFDDLNSRAISQPLVKHIYTADPSAHVFNGKFTSTPRMTLMQEMPLMIWVAILPWKITMCFQWIRRSGSKGQRLCALCKDVPWAAKQLWRLMPMKKDDGITCFFLQKITTVFLKLVWLAVIRLLARLRRSPSAIKIVFPSTRCV